MIYELVLMSIVVPISTTSIYNFLVVEGLKNYSVIPNVWYSSEFYIHLNIPSNAPAQPLFVNVSFEANQSDAQIVFPKGNYVLLTCTPKNGSCTSDVKKVDFLFKTKSQYSFNLKLNINAKILNSTGQQDNGGASSPFNFGGSFNASDALGSFGKIAASSFDCLAQVVGFVLKPENSSVILFVAAVGLGFVIGIKFGRGKNKKSKSLKE